jgi:DnaJ homolog subfamily C member 3
MQEVLQAEFDEPTFIVKVELMLKQQKYEQAHQTVKELIVERFGGRAGGSIGQLYQRTEQALKKSKQKDYYKILGVSPDLDDHSLKRVYRKLALQYHPDKVQDGDKAEAEARFAELNEAYEVLSDPEKKRTWEMGEDPFREDPRQHPGHPGGFHFHHPGQHSFRFNF